MCYFFGRGQPEGEISRLVFKSIGHCLKNYSYDEDNNLLPKT